MTYLLLNAKYKYMNITINSCFPHTFVILTQHTPHTFVILTQHRTTLNSDKGMASACLEHNYELFSLPWYSTIVPY
jgi:hypothetical protein